MKRALTMLLLVGLVRVACAQDASVIKEWLAQQPWYKQCQASLPFKWGPRFNMSLKECSDRGRSRDECFPLAMRANLNWITANNPHWDQCFESNLPPKVAACKIKTRYEEQECLLKLDYEEGQRCVKAVADKANACLAAHVKAEIARTPLIRDPLKVTLSSGITLYDWIVEARQRAGKPEEAQALFNETSAHMRAYGAHPDLVALRDQALGRLIGAIRLGSEEEARQAIPKLEALQKTAGNTPRLLQQLGRAYHLAGNFDKARQAYSALLQTMKPDAAGRKAVVAALGQIDKRIKPEVQAMPPEAFAANEYLKTELAATQIKAEPADHEVGKMLAGLIYMGERDEALAYFEKVMATRKRGTLDTAYASITLPIMALVATDHVESAARLAAGLPHDPDQKFGFLSLKRGAYSSLVSQLLNPQRWSEARRYVAELDADEQRQANLRITLYETGADKDVEKWFRLASKDEESSFTLNFYISQDALRPDKVKPERLLDIARQLPNKRWPHDPEAKGESTRLLFKAGLCEEGKAFLSGKQPPWKEYAACLAQKGDLKGAEAVMDERSTGNHPYKRESFAFSIGLAIDDPIAAEEWTTRKMGTTWQYSEYFRLAGKDNTRYKLRLLKEQRYAEYWQLAQSYSDREARINAAMFLVSHAWGVANGKQ